MSKTTFFVLETAAGFLFIEIIEWDSIAQSLKETQIALLDREKFKKSIKVVYFRQFKNAEEALESSQAIASGKCSKVLKESLKITFGKNKSYRLGVLDPALGKELSSMGYNVFYDKNLIELHRICHVHLSYVISAYMDSVSHNLFNFQVGLAHSFSRSKLKLDPNRQDKPIQNSIALIENLDKSMNQFSMRVREWYSWHFPELGKILTDNYTYAKAVCLIRLKESFSEKDLPKLVDIVGSDTIAEEIMVAKDISMGQEISECDMVNIEFFAKEYIKIDEQRKDLLDYLSRKLDIVAPNLKALLGEILAAKLIAHAGSLSSLAKYPASTIQILGAEKALFRALKTKGNTPKYGLLFQSTFIGRAALKNKGRISRYLANKCSLAARIDSFTNIPSDVFGKKLREQIEARLLFLSEGVVTKQNLEIMKEAVAEYAEIIKSHEKKHKVKEGSGDTSCETEKVSKERKHKKNKEEVLIDSDDETKNKKKRKSLKDSEKKLKKKKSDVCLST